MNPLTMFSLLDSVMNRIGNAANFGLRIGEDVQNQKNIDRARDDQQNENEITRQREDNAVQRHVADMQASGLSPLAELSDSASSSSGGVVSPTDISGGANVFDNSPFSMLNNMENAEDTKSKEIKNKKDEIDLKFEEVNLVTDLENKKWDIEQKISEIEKNNQDNAESKERIEQMKANIKVLQKQIDIMNANLLQTEEETRGLAIENAYKNEKEVAEVYKTQKEGEKTAKEIEGLQFENEIKKLNAEKLKKMTPLEINELALKLEKMAQDKGIEYSEFTTAMLEKGFEWNAKKGEWKYKPKWHRYYNTNKQGRMFTSIKIR